MRIAFVYDAVYPYTKGGVEKRVWELSRELASRGHEVHCFGMKFWKGPDVVEKGGVYLHGVCKPSALYTSSGRRSIFKPLHFSIALVPHLLREEKFDVIDCQSFPYFPVLSCRLISLLKGSKLFVTWHEFWGDYWYEYLGEGLGAVGKGVERLALLLSSNIIAVSGLTKKKLGREVPVVPNGLDYKMVKKAKPMKKHFHVIFIGRLIREKNVGTLIRAISILKKKHPEIRCCIIGEGPEFHNLTNLVHSLNLRKNMEFHGFLKSREQVFSYLKSSKVLAIPSSREGFGMIALEANACGVPVLTVDSPNNAAKELITEGVNGRVVPLSEKGIAGGIELLFGVKVKTEVDDYKWEKIAKRLEEIYRG